MMLPILPNYSVMPPEQGFQVTVFRQPQDQTQFIVLAVILLAAYTLVRT